MGLAEEDDDIKTYEFTVTLAAAGSTREEAWEYAVENFSAEPGEPPEGHESDARMTKDAARKVIDKLRDDLWAQTTSRPRSSLPRPSRICSWTSSAAPIRASMRHASGARFKGS